MKQFFRNNKVFIFLIVVFVIAEILVNPIGNFPLNDDWSYTQVLKTYYLTDKIFLGNYPAMTLYTQIIWGYIFVKLFGFNFIILRLSTLVATIVGIRVLYSLLKSISRNETFTIIACLVIMFNPMVFNLTNSYMTDVNFNTLVIICCYFVFKFYNSPALLNYTLLVFFSIALILLRQFGIVIPLALIISSFFARNKKWLFIILSFVAFSLVYYKLKDYEGNLKLDLPEGSAYKFSSHIKFGEPIFWKNLYSNFTSRIREIILQMFMYLLPVCFLFLVPLWRRMNWIKISFMLIAALSLVYILFTSNGLTSESTFTNTMLGNESFHESWSGRHNINLAFVDILKLVQWISCFFTFFTLLMGIYIVITNKNCRRAVFQPFIIFLFSFLILYVAIILVSESYFDRYHIPLITICLLLMSHLTKLSPTSNIRLSIIPIVFWAYISVAGTKDYLTWNRIRWKAYWYLRSELKVPADKINGGGEVNGWNEGNGWGWKDYFTLSKFDYLIQFEPEESFTVSIKEYKFQRYFPYKTDKIHIFVRDSLKLKND